MAGKPGPKKGSKSKSGPDRKPGSGHYRKRPKGYRTKENRDWEIYEQYLSGQTQTQIAESRKMTQAGVSKIVIACHQQFIDSKKSTVEQIKLEQTQELQMIYAHAMDAYHRSAEIDEDGIGDRGQLETAMKAKADIRKIWGADAALKIEGKVYGGIGVLGREQMQVEILLRVKELEGIPAKEESDGLYHHPGENGSAILGPEPQDNILQPPQTTADQ
jgi:hypothetical protein